MMFSSNQELRVSGDFGIQNDFLESLRFVLLKSGYLNHFTRNNKPCQCVFQISANKDAYYIGAVAFNTTDCGAWMPFQFDFDLEIIAKIAEQQIKKMEFPKGFNGDGSNHQGFLIQGADWWGNGKEIGLKEPYHAILKITPYTCYYAK